MSEITIERRFKADQGRVWRAWTDPEVMRLWMGPKSFTVPVSEIDLRVGGRYLYCMRSRMERISGPPGLQGHHPMSRLVLTDSFADAEGNVVPASHYACLDVAFGDVSIH